MRRNGKIARMPYNIREELNRRLRDGKFGPALLKWLNEQPECLEVLDDEFESRPITKQNLSEWRQGGYEDWVRKEEARQRLDVLREKASDLEKDAGGMAIADRLGTLLAAELAVALEQLNEIKDPKERWIQIKETAREVYRLRREDHHARKLRMAEEQYERREKEAEARRLLKLQEAVHNKQLMTSIRGGGREAWKWTDWEIRVKHDLPMPLWWKNPETAEDWSELMMPYWREEAEKGQKAPSVQAPSVQGNSKDQVPKSGGDGGNGPKKGKPKKSKRVRPGRTQSKQKSAGGETGQSESKVGAEKRSAESEAGNQAEQSSPAKGSQTKGSMTETGAVSPGGSESVKPGPGEFEDEDEDEKEDEGEEGNSETKSLVREDLQE